MATLPSVNYSYGYQPKGVDYYRSDDENNNYSGYDLMENSGDIKNIYDKLMEMFGGNSGAPMGSMGGSAGGAVGIGGQGGLGGMFGGSAGGASAGGIGGYGGVAGGGASGGVGGGLGSTGGAIGGGGASGASGASGAGMSGGAMVGGAILAGILAQMAATNNTDTEFEGVKTGNAFSGQFGTEPWLAYFHDKAGLEPTAGEKFDAAVKNEDWETAFKRMPSMMNYWANPTSQWGSSMLQGLGMNRDQADWFQALGGDMSSGTSLINRLFE